MKITGPVYYFHIDELAQVRVERVDWFLYEVKVNGDVWAHTNTLWGAKKFVPEIKLRLLTERVKGLETSK